MSVLVKAFRRPTFATISLCEWMLVLVLSLVLPVLFITEIMPAFRGHESELSTIAWLGSVCIILLIVFSATMSPGVWRQIVRDQEINDEAGYNKVSKDEWQDIHRCEAAIEYLKRRKQRAAIRR